ncbi:MAG TPA: S8 family serine peptidase [Candidatus Acidoferrales bacterium]|nr:S8 family serine peptidase [Candidatus Acidoferrales bacterium]
MATSSTTLAAPGGPKLSKQDRERLASATANGASTVTMLFATIESQTSSVASALGALGATVRKVDGDVGYIRADVPTDKADAAAKLPGVAGSEVDQTFDVTPPDAGEGDTPLQVPPDSTTPAQNAYMPTRDVGSPQFVAAHPTWDGRGITIGHLDTGVDLGHPALQTTSTGERKVIDWVTLTDPVTDPDPSWIKMDRTVTIVNGTFTIGTGATARTYTGAPNGTWRYGEFNENNPDFSRTNGSAAAEYDVACSNRAGVSGDLNRNGKCDEVFAFLWDGFQNGVVWRDSNADLSFADEVGMHEYKKAFEIGEYGRDNPATAIRESVPFVTQIDAANGYVSLGVVSGEHATHVASIMLGGSLFGGAATGAAPGAKEVSIRVCLFTSGCTAHALTEGMIFAVKNEHVDVVNMSIGGLPSLNDGNNARAILYNRLIDKWGAQMFISAGNSGPGVNTIGDPSVATKVMSVGAYWTKDSVFANYGNTAVSNEALHDFSSRGPREDGGLKPDVVAPGNATGAVPTWQPGQCLSTPNCGPGFGMLNGTSMAAPQATGAAALLLSAAIQTGVGHKPDRLRQAMRSSARYLANYQAHEQGFGLIQVGAAWDLLSQNVKTADITSAVPTNTKLSAFLATPGIGTGIYDREGVHVGAAPYTRTYSFTRTDGGQGTFNLSWIGNDGTFSLPAGVTSVTFDKKSSASLTVTVTPGASGVHSALLLLDDPKTVGVDYATMNTVIVSIPLNAANNYKASVSGSANRFEAGQPKAFFDVPAGTTAMRMTLQILNGRVNATPLHPFGVPLTGIGLTTGPATVSRIITTGPTDGVWEVVDAASRAAVPPSSTYVVTFEAFKVTLSPTTWTNDPTKIGTPYANPFTATNDFAAVSTTQTGSSFASASSTSATIAAGGAQQSYNITVPSGSTSLNASIGGASDPGADLDLFLFDCHTGTCVLAGSSTSSSANESVTVSSPAAGAWKAVVDPFDVPSGSTSYTYSDAISNPAYGSVTVPANAATPRATGESWTFTATGTANSAAGTGRFLRATVSVLTGSSTLGSATVLFNNVTP